MLNFVRFIWVICILITKNSFIPFLLSRTRLPDDCLFGGPCSRVCTNHGPVGRWISPSSTKRRTGGPPSIEYRLFREFPSQFVRRFSLSRRWTDRYTEWNHPHGLMCRTFCLRTEPTVSRVGLLSPGKDVGWGIHHLVHYITCRSTCEVHVDSV